MSGAIVLRESLDWIKEHIVPVGKKGEWWYERLNNWHNLEQKEYGKVIAINVRTGEYIIAATSPEAMDCAKSKFSSSAPLFVTFIHRYVAEATLRIIAEDGEQIIREWYHHGRMGQFHKECDRLYEKFADEIEEKFKTLPRHAHAIISVDRGTYIIGNDPREVEEKARVVFPVIGKRVYGPSSGKIEYVPW